MLMNREGWAGARATIAVLGLAALLAPGIAGCATATPEAAEPTVPAGDRMATLTAVAMAPESQREIDEAPGEASQATEVILLEGVPTPITEASDPMAVLQATQTALSQDVADVSELVDRQEPLATFTPDPRGARVSGRLVYVRGGKLILADADGANSAPLELENEMPAIWAPPEDPGRAWASNDGQWFALFAGPDATLWVTRADGTANRAVSGPNLPTNEHVVTVGDGREQTVRLLPGIDYTLAVTSAGPSPFAVFVDDNSRHVRGEGRLRVIHAAASMADTRLVPAVNDSVITGAIPYGGSTGDQRAVAGRLQIDLLDPQGGLVASLPAFDLGDKELVTVFLYGDEELVGARTSYEPGTQPAAGTSRVRIFNSGSEPLTATIDEANLLVEELAAGELSSYVAVPAVASEDVTRDLEQMVYGLRSGEEPVSWSPDDERLAFVGASDGQVDLYITDREGPAERVTNDSRLDANPVWSPSGGNLVWISADDRYQQHEIAYRTSDGEIGVVDLSEVRKAAGWSETAPVMFPTGLGWVDEERFFMFPRSAQVSAGIWLYDVQKGAISQIYSEPIEHPQWSDEARAWALDRQDETGVIEVVSSAGDVRTLVDGGGSHPAWSPDGKLISYSEGENTSSDGWRLHVIQADGTDDRTLTEWLPVLQQEPPVPGPNAKRYWFDDNAVIGFTKAGTDYGKAEQAGPMNPVEAGPDIENLWLVSSDGADAPRQGSDLTQIFYMKDVRQSPDGSTIALVAFSYLDRAMQLWAVSAEGGSPVHVDGPVRWYAWLE